MFTLKKLNFFTKKETVPAVFKPFLWSYDVNQMDLMRDKRRIITNVLNFGTIEAVKELFKIYKKKDIIESVADPMPGEWNKKSLNFWGLIFSVKPKKSFRQFK